MPVEIREMVVKAIVPAKMIENTQEGDKNAIPQIVNDPIDQQELIEACVEAVLRILEKRERR